MPSIHYSSFEVPGEDGLGGVVEGFVEQTRNVLIGVRGADRAGAPGGLVARARGRPPRPRDARRPSKARRSSTACWRSRTRSCTRRTSGCATQRRRGCGPSRSTSMRSSDIRLLQDFILEQARRSSVPVVENGSIEPAIDTVMELVPASAERPTARGADDDGRACRGGGRDRRAAGSTALQLRVVPPRDRAGGARGRALARPRRPGERGGGGVLRDGGCARRAADHGPGRDRRRGHRGPHDHRRADRRGRGATSTSRSTRSRAAGSSPAAGTARSR